MTADKLKEILICNEPSFGYNGKEYSICSPNGCFYVTAEDSQGDTDLEFLSVDEMLNNWMIQGKPFRDILDQIDLH